MGRAGFARLRARPAFAFAELPLRVFRASSLLRTNRRSFDCASRDKTARGFAQDDRAHTRFIQTSYRTILGSCSSVWAHTAHTGLIWIKRFAEAYGSILPSGGRRCGRRPA